MVLEFRMRFSYVIALALLCAAILSHCGNSQRAERGEVRRIGVDPNYPPFELIDSVSGEIVGFDIDLITRICDMNKWSCKIVRTPFDELVDAVSQGRLDIAISAMTITPARQALVDFSEPYYLTGQSLVVPVSDTVTRVIEDLRGKRVGVQAGTIAEQSARSVEGVQVFRFESTREAMEQLSEGKLDAVLEDLPVAQQLVPQFDSLALVDITLDAEYYGIAVGKDADHLLTSIDSALAIILGSDQFDRLHIKWFGYPLLDEEGTALTDTAY
jgi:ABC-type amino acid transport substrate-binding protein